MTDTSEPKVFNLSGEPHISQPHTIADGALIERLGELLEMARSGEVVGIAYVAQHKDETISHASYGRLLCYTVMGAMFALLTDVRNTIR